MKRIRIVMVVLLVGIAALVAAIVFLSIRGVSTEGYPTAYVTATPAQTSTGPVVIPYGSTPVPMATTSTVQTVAIVRTGDLFHTPVKCISKFNDESSWLICEPGVIAHDRPSWTIPGTAETWHPNIPEGGFTYFSLGGGKITVDGVTLSMPFEKGRNYLVLIRGRIDDGIVDNDLNITGDLFDFKPGHAIYTHMPSGAYVSKNWFRDQMVASSTRNYTNCGATGCSTIHVILFDVSSHFLQVFEVQANKLGTWKLIASN